MPSPFPGMDPFLEPHWLDVHHRLVTHASEWLNGHLPGDLIATTDERVAVESEDEILRRIGPDIKVFSPASADPVHEAGAVVIEAPYKFVVDLDPIKEPFIRIVDSGGQLICVVEFVSPSNKRSPGLEEYRRKRDELLKSNVHVVEIDLVRGGSWRALMRPGACPRQAVSVYRAIVRTGGLRAGGYLFPMPLDKPGPEIPVPLRPSDQAVKLPLQQLIHQVYDRGRYHLRLDYTQPVDPPFDAEESQVVAAILKSSGKIG